MTAQSKEKFKNMGKGRISDKISQDVAENLEKFRDPVVLGELVYLLTEERENTNRLLKTLLERIERLEAKLTGNGPSGGKEVMLPEADERILGAVRKIGRATAADVQKELGYRGKNAASARMNRLCEMGLLRKKQVGRKVYFLSR